MKVIVGLGNPGVKYQFTRHNLGFMLIDRLAGEEAFQKKHSNLILKRKDILLVKPQTFMNLSGQAVQQVMSFYKVSLEDLIVIHDDKDLDFGMIRFQKNRGHGGHNGIRDIHQALGSQDYCRLKMGVFPKSSPANENINSAGKNLDEVNNPPSPSVLSNKQGFDPFNLNRPKNLSTSDLVLSPFSKEEQTQIPELLDKAESALHCWIKEGYQKAGNQYN